MNNLFTNPFLSYVELEEDANEIEIEQPEDNLKPFFDEVWLLKKEMASIDDLLALLKAAKEEVKFSCRQDASRTIRDRMKNHILEILKTYQRIRERLEGMDRANSANRRLSGYGEGTAVDRIRTSVTNGLRKNLKDSMIYFQGLRQRIMADYSEQVKRDCYILTGEVMTDEAVEKMISDGTSEDLIRRAICSSRGGELIDIVSEIHNSRGIETEIQNRHREVKELENSMFELQELFLEMAVLVETQDEVINDIEHNISRAAHYVCAGANELSSTRRYQRRSRKCMSISIILLLLLLLVLVLIVILIATSLSKS